MPTVEDYFDDDTDAPLPSSSRPAGRLQGAGLQGALLEEISTDDPDLPELELDYDVMAEQGRGIYGANATAPASSANAKGKLAMREDPGEVRPAGGSGQGPKIDPNSAMGGFMGDMMRLQKAEDERMERLRRQMGGAHVA
jgi:signal recognition particle subunit SRP19